MKILVIPGPNGQIYTGQRMNGQAVPETARLVDVQSAELGFCEVAILRDNGTVEIVPDYRGFGPYYDQQANTANRIVPRHITEIGVVPPNENGHPVSSGWQHMAMTPRAETTAERNARQAAEAQAAAAAEAQRKANRVLSPVQIRLAAIQMGIRADIEALVANPATPQAFKDYWEYATEFRRASPMWPQALQLIGKTEADLDQLYDFGEAL